MTHPIKVHWLDRSIQVYNFHSAQCKVEPGWTITRTAEALNRSLGSVSQDVMLASFSITCEKQLRRYSSMKDAVEFVKEKKREMMLREI